MITGHSGQLVEEFQEEVFLEQGLVEEDGLIPIINDEIYHPESDNVALYLASNPDHRYFVTSFGQTRGGSIALANSYSQGLKGSAASHVTSYGIGY